MSAPVDPLVRALTAEAGAAAVAILVLAPAAQPWRGRAAPTRSWGPPLALAATTAAGFWLTRGKPEFPPVRAVSWIFYAALAGGVCGTFEALRGRSVRTLRGLASVLLPVLVLGFQRERHWARIEGLAWTAGLAALVFAVWNALAAREERRGGAHALGLALATALAAGSYGLGGGWIFAQLTGALGLAVGLCALLGLWRGAPGLGSAGVAPFVLLHYGMLWIARWLNELSSASFLLLSLAPLAAACTRLVPSTRPRLETVLAILAPTLVAAAALAVELRASSPGAY